METPRASSMFRKAAGLVGEFRRRFSGAVAFLLTGKAADVPKPSSAPLAPAVPAAPATFTAVPLPTGEGQRLKPVAVGPRPEPRYSFSVLDDLARRPVEGRKYSLDQVAAEWAREFVHLRPELRARALFRCPVVRLSADVSRPGSVVDQESLAFCLALCRYAGVDPASVGLGERAIRRQLDFFEEAAREDHAMVASGDDRRALAKLLEKYDQSLACENFSR